MQIYKSAKDYAAKVVASAMEHGESGHRTAFNAGRDAQSIITMVNRQFPGYMVDNFKSAIRFLEIAADDGRITWAGLSIILFHVVVALSYKTDKGNLFACALMARAINALHGNAKAFKNYMNALELKIKRNGEGA